MGQWHVVLNDRVLHRFWVDEGDSVKVGRGKSADVNLDNTAVSRQHAVIGMSGGRYYVKDLESKNGTRLNGKKITGTVSIGPSDRIDIAKFRLMPATTSGDTYPPYAMIRDADFDPTKLSDMASDFEGTVFVMPRELVSIQGDIVPERLSLKDCIKVAIGKDEKCDLKIEGSGIGSIQCYIITEGDKHYLIHHPGSTVTTVNGKKVIDKQLLKKGDTIGIGKSKIKYS